MNKINRRIAAVILIIIGVISFYYNWFPAWTIAFMFGILIILKDANKRK